MNLLVSYAHLITSRRMRETVEHAASHGHSWLIDCGAFTAHNTGRTIELDDYCRYIETLPFKPWGYFSLDVIGDGPASQRNYQAMLDRGMTPIPIFTRGAPLEDLDRMMQTAPLVGIGGLVVRFNRPHRYLKAIVDHTKGHPLHTLGFTDLSWLTYIKPRSCDSSSWMQAFRYGQLTIYMGYGRFELYNTRHAQKRPPSPAQSDIIRSMGYDPYHLMKAEAWCSGGIGSWISAIGWLRYSRELEDHNITCHLASTTSPWAIPILEAADAILDNKLDAREAQAEYQRKRGNRPANRNSLWRPRPDEPAAAPP